MDEMAKRIQKYGLVNINVLRNTLLKVICHDGLRHHRRKAHQTGKIPAAASQSIAMAAFDHIMLRIFSSHNLYSVGAHL